MSAEAASPIPTYRVCDGVRVRFADNRTDSDITMLLLAPWPESLWAFRRICDRVSAVGRVVAIDLPGFGHSDGRPELIALSPAISGAGCTYRRRRRIATSGSALTTTSSTPPGRPSAARQMPPCS
jgi:pimeloyl-ACP methyl ester carboxylesterase